MNALGVIRGLFVLVLCLALAVPAQAQYYQQGYGGYYNQGGYYPQSGGFRGVTSSIGNRP